MKLLKSKFILKCVREIFYDLLGDCQLQSTLRLMD